MEDSTRVGKEHHDTNQKANFKKLTFSPQPKASNGIPNSQKNSKRRHGIKRRHSLRHVHAKIRRLRRQLFSTLF